MRRERDIRLKRRGIRWGSDMRRCVLKGAARREHGNRRALRLTRPMRLQSGERLRLANRRMARKPCPKRLPIADAPA